MSVVAEFPPELGLIASNFLRTECDFVQSPLFRIAETAYSGRSVFAVRQLSAGETIYRAESPFLSVIYKPFRKEVCANCFAYDNGRKMKVAVTRDDGTKAGKARGLAWLCSESCRARWTTRIGEEGIDGLLCIASAMAKSWKAKQAQNRTDSPRETNDKHPHKLLLEEIESAWHCATEKASAPSKVRLVEEDDDEDDVYFLLDGVIASARSQETWQRFLSLAPSLQPYEGEQGQEKLASHIRIYHFLRTHLPPSILPYCTPETILAIITRDHGNSFGIFESDLGRSGEMLGYGSWTEASFFNHSCAPNMRKRREGQSYLFQTISDVMDGEELCISYIGEGQDLAGMQLPERRGRLMKGWGFVCQCERCKREQAAQPNGTE